MGLVLFVGGPLDGRAYDTEMLLAAESLTLPVIGYVWTSEKRTSETTGAVAQIWRYQDAEGAALVASTPSAVEDVPGSSVVPPTRRDVTSELRNAVTDASHGASTGPAPTLNFSDMLTAQHSGDTNSSEHLVTSETHVDVPSTSAPTEPTAQHAQTSSDDLSGEALIARRTALKLSRKQVAELTGLAQSKIGGIETGVAKRIKPEELRTYADALARVETERGVGGRG